MKRLKQPELPGCAPLPLSYKETPVVNGDGQPLTMCQLCEGSGALCVATRTVTNAMTGQSTKETVKFTGTKRSKFKRGWEVVETPCTVCNGTGLVRKQEAQS